MTIPHDARFRAYLGILTLLLAGTSAVFFVLRDRLPYGHGAPWVLPAGLALASFPAWLFLREVRLRRDLTREAFFELPADAIPRRPGATYIGRGFAWTTAHAERLGELSLTPPKALERGMIKNPGNWLIQGIGAGSHRDLFIPDELLTQHTLLFGAPGSGKTRFLELLIAQAIARGDAVVVIDPKGDERLLDRTWDAARRSGRCADFRFFGLPFPFQSCRYNPLAEYVRPNEITDRIALVLPKGGGDAEAFRNFAWDFTNTVTTALHLLGEPITLAGLQNACLYDTWTLVRRLLRHHCPGIDSAGDLKLALDRYRDHCATRGVSFPELDKLIRMASLDRGYFDKISSALKPLFSKLLSPTVGYLLCPGHADPPADAARAGPAPEIRWSSIDRDRRIVYFFLGSMLGAETASGVARMTLADLQGYLGKKYAYERRADYGRISVFVDEMGDVLAPETVHLLNKARGAELALTLAGQSLADLEAALGHEAAARRVLANVATFLMFRAPNPEDARHFSELSGRRPMRVVTESEMYEPALLSSGHRAIDDFSFRATRSTTTRSEPLVPGYLLGQLPRFHYFAHHSGEVLKGALPLLDPPCDLYSPRLKGGTVP